MGMVRCLGCGTVGNHGRSGRCLSCKRIASRITEMNPQRRAIKALRYGGDHEKVRKQWGEALSVASYPCARCGMPVDNTMDWHLDHVGGARVPSHAACNTGARNDPGKGWTS